MTASGPGEGAAVGALLVEYASLREESLAAIEHRMTATNFTFAALAVIIGGLLTADIDPRVVGLTLLIVVPQLAKAGLLVWLGEYERSQRAGRHVSTIEMRVNDLLGGEVLTWEGGLTSASSHMAYPYRAVMLLLLGTGYVAAAMGVAFLADLSGWRPELGWSTILLGAGLATCVWEFWFFAYFMRLWRAARGATERQPDPAAVEADVTA